MTLALLATLLLFSLFLPTSVSAVCPACTVAVGAGVGLSRWLGIDDVIAGVWVGGLLVSSSFWFASFLEKKNVRIPAKKLISLLVFYLLTIPPLYFTGVVGNSLNTILGIDKLLLGTVVGSLLFFLSIIIDRVLRSKNEGKVFVPYQKVILPVSLLLAGSVVFYVITA